MRVLGPLLIVASVFLLIGGIGSIFAMESSDGLRQFYNGILCDPGEELVAQSIQATYMRPNERRVTMHCASPTGQLTSVDGKLVLMLGTVFTVPFMVGLVMTIVAAKRHTTQTVQDFLNTGVNVSGGKRVINLRDGETLPSDVQAKMRSMGYGNLVDAIQSSTPAESVRAGGSLTDQLKDLQAAYDKRLISKEEFDRARQQILDNLGRSE